MSHQEGTWNDLTKRERRELLRTAYPERTEYLINFEARMQWHKLLPSTQRDLSYIDFNYVLGKMDSAG